MHAGVGIDNLFVRCLTSADNDILVMERAPRFYGRTFRGHKLEMEHQQGFLLKESSESTVYDGKPIRLRRTDGPGETAESSSLGLGSVPMFTPFCPARSRTFYSTTFYNEWHPRSDNGFPEDG